MDKLAKRETSIVTIAGPAQRSWVGNVTLEVIFEHEVLAIIKGQKSAKFEINNDCRFKIRTISTAFPTLEVTVSALQSRDTSIQLYLIGGSPENAKLVAKTTYL